MKKLKLGLLATIGFASVIAFTPGNAKLELGTKAPMADTKMKDVSGKMLSLNDVKKDNGLLVIFSCNTCPFVLAWEDRYPELFDKADQMQIGVALVNSNEAKRGGEDSSIEMEKHARENGYENIPYLIDKDSQLANAFGAKTTPHVFLFDKNLELVYEGAIDDNHKDANEVTMRYLDDAIVNLASEQEINPNKTKAIGCSIKRVKK